MKIDIRRDASTVENSEVEWVHPEQLDEVTASSCHLVSLNDTLDIYEPKDRWDVLKQAASKVRYNGTISLQGLDISVLVLNAVNGRYTNPQVNSMLLGKSSVSDVQEMGQVLKDLGFKLTKTRLDQHEYYIEAERPKPNA